MNLDELSPLELEEVVNSGDVSKYLSASAAGAKVGVTAKVDLSSTKSSDSAVAPTLPSTETKNPQPAPTSITNELQHNTALVPERAEGFDFKTPVELLFFLDDDIQAGVTKLHKWQIQFMIDFANEKHDKENPFQACVQAANGSGKDKIIVAACSVWLCMRYLQARCAVTNGSGDQLDNQTEVHIDYLCKQANKKIAPNIWKCNYRYYECLATGSPIKLFATDEPGKAEGYHPLISGGKMGIFASEAKSIPDEIFGALSRCTGYTHRVDVSSPGNVLGYFYETCTINSVSRNSLSDIKSVTSTTYIHYKVTAYDCPHITRAEIESFASKLPGGKNSPIFKSGVEAEFGSTGEMVVLSSTLVWNAMFNHGKLKHMPEPFNKAGLDLSDGGAENVLVVRNGNKVIGIEAFKFPDTEDTIDYLQELFHKYELNHYEAKIFGDCVGIGSPMLKSLRRKGWTNIHFFDSRHNSAEPKVYKNLVTDKWFHFQKLIKELILQPDKETQKQLSSRYYKITQNQAHQLLSKLEQKARGYPSPDRADAHIYAFCDYKSTIVETAPTEKEKPFKQPDVPKPKSTFTEQAWVKTQTANPKWDRNPSRNKDFSLLREDIKRNNELIRQKNKNHKEESVLV